MVYDEILDIHNWRFDSEKEVWVCKNGCVWSSKKFYDFFWQTISELCTDEMINDHNERLKINRYTPELLTDTRDEES